MIEVNIYKILTDVLPPRLRSFELEAFLKVFNKPLNTVLTSLYELHEQKKYDMAFNGQTIYLQHILNDMFDEDQRRIWIETHTAAPLYLFNADVAAEPVYFYNDGEAVTQQQYLYNYNEVGGYFVVHIPTGWSGNIEMLHYIINRYKLKGKHYQIIED